jgi:pimeloyl-ACP methyl ester carboxylesterase
MENSVPISKLRMSDGVHVVLEHWPGRAQWPQLLLLHGFGQNRIAWKSSAETLQQLGYGVWITDARGHGDSEWSAQANYPLERFTDDALEVLAHIHAQAPDAQRIVVGASMGGLLGLLCAEKLPHAVSALALVDVTPRWEQAGVERIFAFMRANPDGFNDVQAADHAVRSYLPHRERSDPDRLRAHLRAGSDGRLRWHWDPQLLHAINESTERYTPLLEKAARAVRCPLLLLSGGRSDVVSDATIDSFLQTVPHAQHHRIAAATHMVVGDQHQQFTQHIAAFLQPFQPGVAL